MQKLFELWVGCQDYLQLSKGVFLDPKEIIEFVDWLKEEDLVLVILSKMISIRVAYNPLLK
jgi:hypothetical protein